MQHWSASTANAGDKVCRTYTVEYVNGGWIVTRTISGRNDLHPSGRVAAACLGIQRKHRVTSFVPHTGKDPFQVA